MTIHRVAAEGARLEDLDVARRLGQRIWEESDLQLDFSEVEGVTPEFAADRAFDAAEASLDSLPGARLGAPAGVSASLPQGADVAE